ncbi:hypothetical protein PoB_001549800 [Plakobranchus ocellatus]|uniref:Uncharacterized protein n=1 Tax=Plakobranchus ocellatus TaxID=259542 RepID=A0AAV3Z334_9GAST|nr:hypothetical protein PoB_001549800 [Plakobranchus ocellatus]
MGNPTPNLSLTRKRTMKELASLRGNLMITKLTHRMDPLGYLDTGVYFCTGENYLGVTTQEINIGVRKKTMKELASLRGNLMTTKLTHRMDPLGYLDTGVYFCTGENYLGVTTQEINIGVRCPPQQIWQTTQHKAMLGQTSTVSLPVYSYPAPHELSLQRATDNRNLTGSPRHSVQFSSSYEPFGLVNITISDVVKEDFANYSISIDNGEGEALVLNFSIHEDFIASVILGIIFATSVVFNVFLCRKYLTLRETLNAQRKSNPGSQGRRNSETIPKVVYQSDFGDKEEAITTV